MTFTFYHKILLYYNDMNIYKKLDQQIFICCRIGSDFVQMNFFLGWTQILYKNLITQSIFEKQNLIFRMRPHLLPTFKLSIATWGEKRLLPWYLKGDLRLGGSEQYSLERTQTNHPLSLRWAIIIVRLYIKNYLFSTFIWEVSVINRKSNISCLLFPATWLSIKYSIKLHLICLGQVIWFFWEEGPIKNSNGNWGSK